MTTAAEPQGLQLPDVDSATAVLETVYAESLFNKLAELGIQPQTEEEAVSLLEAAHMLDMAETYQAKQASAGPSPIVDATQRLKVVLASYGLGEQPQLGTKQAARAWAQHPDVYKAALALSLAESQQSQPPQT